MQMPKVQRTNAQAVKRKRGRPRIEERQAEATIARILKAARAEFVERSLPGARVDEIARRAGVNKRLLYHYIGNKEAIYSRVMLEAYREIRAGEERLHLATLDPKTAMARLVGFTFDHFQANPWFIRLLATENMQRARHIRKIRDLRQLHSHIIGQIKDILARGQKAGQFRKPIDPLELYLTIAGLSYFYFSNIHTLSTVFSSDLLTAGRMAKRRKHAIAVVASYVEANGSL
jgi:TetR/AcrR family transcriptional regulator